MAHAQKLDFVFRRNGRVHLNRPGGGGEGSVQSTTGSRSVRISGSNAGSTVSRGSVKSTGYPLHTPVSPSLALPCFTVCHHISTGLYFVTLRITWLVLVSLRVNIETYSTTKIIPCQDIYTPVDVNDAFFRYVTKNILIERRIVRAHVWLRATKPTHSGHLPEVKKNHQHFFYFSVYVLHFIVCYCYCIINIFTQFLVNFIHTINLIVAPCIFVESLQFINQQMHI